MSADILMFVLLVLALAIGFGLGRSRKRPQAGVDPKFYQSLNYLLNDEQDLAVDSLIEQLGIDDGTYDTYLALGTLVRKRGEVDKAINIHQNLLARPDLPPNKRAEAELELASDYLGAGLLGRAENLLQDMLNRLGSARGDWAKHARTQAQGLLVGLYERESDWASAFAIARVLAKGNSEYAPLVAHICCELAEAALPVGEQSQEMREPIKEAREHIKNARKFAPDSARVAMVAGKIELQAGDASSALKKLRQSLQLDADMALDLLPLAAAACESLQAPDKLLQFVQQAIATSGTSAVAGAARQPRLSASTDTASVVEREHDAASEAAAVVVRAPVDLLLTEAQLTQSLKGEAAAQQLLLRYLGSVNSVGQLSGLLAAIDEQALAQAIPDGLLQTLVQHLQQLVAVQQDYRCRNCGFGSSSRHWRCPSCQQWGSHRAQA